MAATRTPWWARTWPVLAWVVLIATAVLGTGGLIAAIAGIVLIATVFAAVYHAEVVAHRTGQPFGTLVLALAVTVIETALIVLSAPAESAGLPRYRLRGRHGIIIAALVLLPEGLAARAADDPRQHARQRRALARRVVLAVPSPRDHERRSLALATRFFTADAIGKFRHRVAEGISRGRFQDRGAVFHCQHGPLVQGSRPWERPRGSRCCYHCALRRTGIFHWSRPRLRFSLD
jgi:hypothetical protein